MTLALSFLGLLFILFTICGIFDMIYNKIYRKYKRGR